jgi:hypothetical protein
VVVYQGVGRFKERASPGSLVKRVSSGLLTLATTRFDVTKSKIGSAGDQRPRTFRAREQHNRWALESDAARSEVEDEHKQTAQ